MEQTPGIPAAEPHRESELNALIREAVDSLSEGMSLYTVDRRLIFANQATLQDFPTFFGALKRALRWSEAAVESTAATEAGWTEEQVRADSQQTEDYLFSGAPTDIETENRGQFVRVIVRQLSDGRYVAVSTNITDLREKEIELQAAKERAEAASEAKSRFLANVSHEIRTPLNGILGMAQILGSSGLAGAQREQVEAILDSGKSLIALLNDVLDLAKIEADKMEIAPVDADLSHVLRRLSKLWSPAADEKGIALNLSLSATLPPRLKFDPVRVRQCISNLISNAIKFTAEGEVDVRVSIPTSGPNAGLVQVKVTDTGIGMDQGALKRLFNPFTQGDSSTARQFGGTGLGLSITKRLAQMMAGDVTVESVAGKGSTFVLSFAAEAVEPARIPDDPQRQSTSIIAGLRVLVVDDVPLNRKVARLFLENQGVVVTEADNGSEALMRLAENTFDIVLLDVHMPVMDGLETMRRIRDSGDAWSNVPLVALTANAMSGDRERYVGAGMNGYVSKPIDMRELFAEIGRVLGTIEAAPIFARRAG